eukprot:6574086-Prymnesium_polylepis.1
MSTLFVLLALAPALRACWNVPDTSVVRHALTHAVLTIPVGPGGRELLYSDRKLEYCTYRVLCACAGVVQKVGGLGRPRAVHHSTVASMS